MNLHHFVKLDNPAWWALTGPQQSFATGASAVRRYRRGLLPFAAFDEASPEEVGSLGPWLERGEVFFLIGQLPALPAHWKVLKELPCVQMVFQGTGVEGSKEPEAMAMQEGPVIISRLTDTDSRELYDLITRVQPGYYEPDTYRLGVYYGIRQGGKLVAVGGERLRLEGLTEVSAICTDPAFTGRGYAQRLITHLCQTHLDQGVTSFLHVLETNARAIRLYEYLGFAQRRLISFWKLMA